MADLAEQLKLAAEANQILRREKKALADALAALRAKSERAKLQAENSALSGGMSLGVSKKGCLSVYGLQARPVSLYKDQWRLILAVAAHIQEFIEENDSRLLTIVESRARRSERKYIGTERRKKAR